jgi:hypothetical protein
MRQLPNAVVLEFASHDEAPSCHTVQLSMDFAVAVARKDRTGKSDPRPTLIRR